VWCSAVQCSTRYVCEEIKSTGQISDFDIHTVEYNHNN
jgi:hypothetical protein